MNRNLYKNQQVKFALWGKRLVGEMLSPEAAIDIVIEGQKSIPVPRKNADMLVQEAKQLVGLENEVECAKIDVARARFEAIVRAVQQRSYTQGVLDSIIIDLNNFQLAEWIGKLDQLSAGRASLVAQFGEEDVVVKALDAKKNDIVEMEHQSDAKMDYYSDQLDLGWPLELEDSFEEAAKQGYIQQVLTKIAQLEVIIGNGFQYLDESAKPDMGSAYLNKINEQKDFLRNLNLVTVLNPDQRASLENMDFAQNNLDAALKGGNEGHMVGASQCYAANAAEQEARNVWNQIKDDTHSDADDQWGGLRRDGINAFKEGMEKFRTAKGTGKWTEAREAFKRATAAWQELLNKQNKPNPQAEELDEGEDMLPTLNNNISKLKERFKSFENTDIGGTQMYKDLGRSVNDIIIGNLLVNIDTTIISKRVDGALLALQIMEADYNNLKNALLPQKLQGAMENISAQLDQGNTRIDYGMVVNDFMKNPGSLSDFQKELMSSTGGMVVSGVYSTPPSNTRNSNSGVKYRVVAMLRAGNVSVSRSPIGSLDYSNDQIKVFDRQDALDFARKKAVEAYLQQTINPDKAEAVQDYVLDSRDWRQDLGSPAQARQSYLALLEGQEFDVQNSIYHVKIEGGKVKVTTVKTAPTPAPAEETPTPGESLVA